MDLTADGMTMLFNDVQYSNALIPIGPIESDNMISVSEVISLKDSDLIE